MGAQIATGAAGRLGYSTAGWIYPSTTMPVLTNVIVSTALRMGHDGTDAPRAEKEH